MLDRIVSVFDLESTGLGFGAGIVEVAYASFPISMLMSDEYPHVFNFLVNPGCDIEPAAQKVHGISIEDVMFEPKIEHLWEKHLSHVFSESHYASGFNSDKYDIPLLNANLERAGLGKDSLLNNPGLDVMKIYRRLTGRRKGTLSEIAAEYGVEHLEQHRAGGDVKATIGVLKALVAEYGIEAVLDLNGPVVPKDTLEVARIYREKKLLLDTLTKELDALKKPLIDAMGDEDVLETPYLIVQKKPGRKNIDYKKLIGDLDLKEDEVAAYTKVSAPITSINLV